MTETTSDLPAILKRYIQASGLTIDQWAKLYPRDGKPDGVHPRTIYFWMAGKLRMPAELREELERWQAEQPETCPTCGQTLDLHAAR